MGFINTAVPSTTGTVSKYRPTAKSWAVLVGIGPSHLHDPL